jgi:hypothetical protein
MDNRRGLREVRVSKVKLLKQLKENRSKHYEEHEAAIAGWKEKLSELADLLQGLIRHEKADWGIVEETYEELIDLEKPQNYLDSYDDTIALVEASLDDAFVLTQSDFKSYWLDKWSWKADFSTSNSRYT